jgi:DNA-binding transcriptional MerR regulator
MNDLTRPSERTAGKPLRYPIRAVSRLTGLSVDTLRAWERRHAVVTPLRDQRGRLYSETDVDRLGLLHQLVQRGHAIGRIAALDTEELRALRSRGPDTPLLDEALLPGAVDLGALLEAARRYDALRLRRELARLAVALPARALAREVALPLLRQVGQAWLEGRLSAAQEHLVTAELRGLLGSLERLQAGAADAPRLILTTPPGELHELGTLVAALLASGAGLQACYLGPSLPAAEVIEAARLAAPRAVVLGTTLADGSSGPREAIAAVAHGLPPGVECWLGGPGAPSAAAALAGTTATVLEDLDAYEHQLARLVGRNPSPRVMRRERGSN